MGDGGEGGKGLEHDYQMFAKPVTDSLANHLIAVYRSPL